MGNFLLSYWWIILLIVIITALIARNLKILAGLIIFILVFIILNLFWQAFISSGFSEAAGCFTTSANDAKLFMDKIDLTIPGTDQNQLLCSQDYENFALLTDCLKDVQRKNNVSFIIYLNIPKFKKTISDSVDRHNQKCPESPLQYPNF